jgi:DNA polymerase-3 subunit beta
MKIECSKEKLSWAVGMADRSTSKNLTLPVLSNILLESDSGKLMIRATNLDVFIEVSFPCKTEKNGLVVLNASALLGFLNGVGKKSNVSLEVVDGNLNIKMETPPFEKMRVKFVWTAGTANVVLNFSGKSIGA